MSVDRFGELAPRLAANGFEPVPVIPGQKRPRPSKWDGGGWAERAHQFADDFTGIIARYTPAVDIDVSDLALVREIEGIVFDVLDCHERPPPARVGMAPRRLLVFRSEEPFGKLQTAEYALPSDPVIDGKPKRSKVEILADGQQFVAYAIHPNTGEPYTWNGGGDPLGMRRADLIPLEQEQAREIIRRAEELLSRHAGGAPKAPKNKAKDAPAEFADAATITDLRSALNALDADDRNTWVAVGHALRGLGAVGRALWLDWSQTSEKWQPSDARQWHGFRTEHTGYAAVFAKAQAAGWVNPRSKASEGRPEAAQQGEADEDDMPGIGPDPTLMTLMSEDAMALDFAAMAEPSYRWSPGLAWMRDNGIVWSRDDALTRYSLAREVARATARQAAAAVKESEARKLATAKCVNAILSLAQSDERLVVPAAAWDSEPMALNTPAGIVALRTGAMRPRGLAYVTQAARVSPVAAPCPTWLRFLEQVFLGDQGLIEFMRRALGYCITGDRREQVLFFWYGTGQNGKSVLVDLVQWLVGDYALKLPASVLMQSKGERHPTELAQLRGKRLAVSSELDEASFFNESLIKELTGDAVLTARFMRQDFFSFDMTQKHVIVGNFKPRLKGGDPAIARRMMLVPFLASFKGSARDPRMLDKLKAEAPAILHWLIGGAVSWSRDGLAVPESVRAASADYLADHDDLALWMDECCQRTGTAPASSLYGSFSLWKRDRGEHAPSMTSWCGRLQALPGISKRKSHGSMVYEGVALTYAAAEALAASRRGF